MRYHNFKAPLAGKLVAIDTVPDEVFSDRVMGDGFAIELTGSSVIAPFDGIVQTVFPTGHAVCIESDEGIQVMIHLGLETHVISGLYTPLVTLHQVVKQGQPLTKINFNKMKKKSSSLLCPVIFLDGSTIELLKEGQHVEQNEENIIVIHKEPLPL